MPPTILDMEPGCQQQSFNGCRDAMLSSPVKECWRHPDPITYARVDGGIPASFQRYLLASRPPIKESWRRPLPAFEDYCWHPGLHSMTVGRIPACIQGLPVVSWPTFNNCGWHPGLHSRFVGGIRASIPSFGAAPATTHGLLAAPSVHSRTASPAQGLLLVSHPRVKEC